MKPERVSGDRRTEPTRTILVVDDDVLIRELLADTLVEERLLSPRGRQWTGSGEASEANGVDLVITDLAMPEQERLETIR